jgi:hypothetical protein
MVQAAAEKVIDFTTADLLARNWWTKMHWLLGEMDKKNTLTMLTMQHAQHVAVLDYQNYQLDKNLFDQHWTAANDIMKLVFNNFYPHKPEAIEPTNKYKDLMDKWNAKFGDIKDPNVKAKYAKLAKEILQKHKAKKEKLSNTKTPAQQQNDTLKKVYESRRNNKRSKGK